MEVDTFKYYPAKIFINIIVVSAKYPAKIFINMIVVSAGGAANASSKDTFPARFPNIFVNYPLGQMRVGDKLWTHWNKAPMRLWQTQLKLKFEL